MPGGCGLRNPGFKRTVQTITYLPHFVSWVIAAGLFYRVLNEWTGIINIAIKGLGFDAVPFLKNPDLFWPLIASVAVWKEVGWTSIIYLGALSSISPELYEAAIIDGAAKRQRIWHVTLPGLLPTIAVMLILTVGQIIRGGGIIPDFEAIWQMRNAMVAMKSDTIAVHTFMEGVHYARYGYATAVGLSESVVALALVVTVNAISKRVRGMGVF